MSNEQVSQIINELEDSMHDKYLEAQDKFIKITNLKIGDRVKVLRKANDDELGWDNKWSPSMDEWLCEVGVIRSFEGTTGISVYISKLEDYWYFPFFVLEKVEEPKYQFKDKDVVLVRDGNDEYWHIAAYKEYNDKHGFPHKCYTGNHKDFVGWKQCIPYKGHEHLFGTKCSC